MFLGLAWPPKRVVHCKWFSLAEFTLALDSIMMALCHFYILLCSKSVQFSAEVTAAKAPLQHLRSFGEILLVTPFLIVIELERD